MGTGKLPGKPDKMLGGDMRGLAFYSVKVVIFLVASCYSNREKLTTSGEWIPAKSSFVNDHAPTNGLTD